MKKHKKTIITVLIIVLIFSTFPLGINNIAKANETDYGLSNPRIENGISTWDCVYFGSYQQSEYEPIKKPENPEGNVIYKDTDGTEFIYSGDYYKREPIKWRVLSVDGNDAFLFADMNLYYEIFNYSWENGNWETCEIRNWLNDTFYNAAFSSEEQNAIKTTMVINEDNPVYGTEAGNNTEDKVYLLSIQEVTNATYGFATGYTNSETRIATGTDFSSSESYSDWWLRSIGSGGVPSIAFRVAYVESKGNIVVGGDLPTIGKMIRPVIHLDLSSNLWSKAEPVSCKNLPEEQATPTPIPTNTPKPTPTQNVETPKVTQAPISQTTIKPTQPQKVTPFIKLTAKPKTVSAPEKVKKLKAKNKKKKSVTLSWRKVKGAKGYQIQYVTNKAFSKKASKFTKKNKFTVKKLKKKKTYYFRVRAYKINGKKKVYGKWSAVKKVKIKK